MYNSIKVHKLNLPRSRKRTLSAAQGLLIPPLLTNAQRRTTLLIRNQFCVFWNFMWSKPYKNIFLSFFFCSTLCLWDSSMLSLVTDHLLSLLWLFHCRNRPYFLLSLLLVNTEAVSCNGAVMHGVALNILVHVFC